MLDADSGVRRTGDQLPGVPRADRPGRDHLVESIQGLPDRLEITPLEIDDAEARALVAFLRTLDGGVDADAVWLEPPGRAVAGALER